MFIVISRKKIREAYIGHCYRRRNVYRVAIASLLVCEYIISHV